VRTHERSDQGWLGRADQTTKVKGMFVHPSQSPPSCAGIPKSFAPVVVDNPDGSDRMTLHVEIPAGSRRMPIRSLNRFAT